MEPMQDIRKYAFKAGLPHELELVSLNTLFRKKKQLITLPHRTGFYHILWVRKGNPIHLVDFVPIEMEPDSMLFLSQDTVHSFDSNSDFEGKAILFTENFFCKTEQDTRLLKSMTLFNDFHSVSRIRLSNGHPVIPALFEQIEAELKNGKDDFQSDILQSLLKTLLLHSERERHQQDFRDIKKSPDFDYVMRFKSLVDAQFKELKQVSGFAGQLGMTEKRLNQATQKVIGKTPKQVIDERVVLEAKRLLVHTAKSIKEIGHSLGFQETTNFTKYFKKRHGLTPVEFRDRLAP